MNDLYVCPMHPEVTSAKPSHCPKCGMDLVLKDSGNNSIHSRSHVDEENASFYPLFLIFTLIVFVVACVGVRDYYFLNNFNWSSVMSNFMAGFFLVFSGFKLLDLKGFAQGYSTYDLLAKRWFGYGYVYPFLELSLGMFYLLGMVTPALNIFTFLLMTFSGLGVALKLLKKEKFQCACLGTFLKVPLTKVTLVEDFGMAIMALVMILM